MIKELLIVVTLAMCGYCIIIYGAIAILSGHQPIMEFVAPAAFIGAPLYFYWMVKYT